MRLAQAHAGIAFIQSSGVYLFAAPQQVMPVAKEAALKAIAIDETVADAYFSLGLVRNLYEWDWGGTTKRSKR